MLKNKTIEPVLSSDEDVSCCQVPTLPLSMIMKHIEISSSSAASQQEQQQDPVPPLLFLEYLVIVRYFDGVEYQMP